MRAGATSSCFSLLLRLLLARGADGEATGWLCLLLAASTGEGDVGPEVGWTSLSVLLAASTAGKGMG
jgi:hypothetical protein